MTTTNPTWTACRALFDQWRLSVNLAADPDEDGPSLGLTGRAGGGRYHQIWWLPDHDLFEITADGGAWQIGPGDTAWDANRDPDGTPTPAPAAPDLAGFVPWPRHGELFAYRPHGGPPAGIWIWQANVTGDALWHAPGVPVPGPTPLRAGAYLTLPDADPWPRELWGQWPADIQRRIRGGEYVSLTEVTAAAGRAPMWWASPAGVEDDAGIEWPDTGPGWPTAGMYRFRMFGDRPAVGEGWTAASLQPYARKLVADAVMVAELLAYTGNPRRVTNRDEITAT